MAKQSAMAKRLDNMQDNWETNKEEGFGSFPEGQFKFQLQNAEIVESQSSGKLQVHREHYCLEGDEAGSVLHDYLQLENDVGRKMTMQWIEQMGREVPSSFADMEEAVAELAEAAPIYMGKVKHKDGFANLRITRLLAGEAETEKADDESEEAEDLWTEDEVLACKDKTELAEIAEYYEFDLSGKLTKKKKEDLIDAMTTGGYWESDDDEEPEEPTEEEKTEEAEEDGNPECFGQYDAKDADCKGCGVKSDCKDAPAEEEEEEANEDAPPAVDDKVRVFLEEHDETYDGVVTSAPPSGKKVQVTFEDGEVKNVPVDENITIVERAEVSEEAEGPSREDLVNFCQGQDVEIDDDDDEDALIEKINEYGWKRKDLMKDEISMLESIEATIE